MIMTDEQVSKTVNRFLCWKLPNDFAPDAAIAFAPGHMTPSSPHWPIGTNLLHAGQVEEMVRYMLKDL